MTSALDQKGLHAATDAYNEFECGSDVDHVRKIVRAYLSTVIPAEIAAVVDQALDLRDKIMRGKRCVTDTGPAVKPVIELASVHILDDLATIIERLAASQADLQEALAESDRNAEKLEALLDPHIAWEGKPSASQAETRRLALEEAAAHLKRQPSFGDGKWAAAHVRALIDQPSTEGGRDG